MSVLCYIKQNKISFIETKSNETKSNMKHFYHESTASAMLSCTLHKGKTTEHSFIPDFKIQFLRIFIAFNICNIQTFPSMVFNCLDVTRFIYKKRRSPCFGI
jgi:hypothetical protein